MGIDWEEMLGAEGDDMWLAYEESVCDAMALEARDNSFGGYDYGARSNPFASKAKTDSKKPAKKPAKVSTFLCKVAGVTFDNPDGENRQDVLKAFIDEKGDGTSWAGPGELKAVEKDIEVYVDGKLIGRVPWEDKKAVAEDERTQNNSVFVKMVYYPQHDIYTAKLFASARSKGNRNGCNNTR